MAICVLAAGLATAATTANALQAQQTDWYVNDNPILWGPQEAWFEGDAGQGHGTNNYRWTYAIGGARSADNWVHWYMGERIGRQQVAAYIPGTKATAAVTYVVVFDGAAQYSSQIHQNLNAGKWINLGTWDFNGADVTITLNDNDAVQHYQTDGKANSRIGIDAIMMRCVSNCTASNPTPDPTPNPTAQPSPPHSVNAAAHGSNQIRVNWSPPSDDGGSPISSYRVVYSRPAIGASGPWSGTATVTGTSHTSGDLRFGVTYTVAVTAMNQQGLSSSPATATATTRAAQPPSPPANVQLSYDDTAGDRKIAVSWSQPASSGTSAIAGYNITVSRPGRTFGPFSSSASSRSFTFGNPLRGTTYSVSVTARNSNSTSRAAARDIAIPGRTVSSPGPPRNVRATSTGEGIVNVTWDAPADSGSSAIRNYDVVFSRPAYRNHPAHGRLDEFTTTRRATGTSYAADDLFPGMRYQVRVTARNQDGRTRKSSNVYITTSPRVRVELEGRPWWNPIDDDDALVFWEPIQGARQYRLDWRYIEIDTDALRDVYNRLESGNISPSEAQRLSDQAAELLEGEEVRASRISGNSRPASSRDPEINFNVNLRTYQDTRPNPDEFEDWNPDRTEFRIHSNQKQYVLQARVSANGFGITGRTSDTFWQTDWSDWVYHPSSKLTAGCQALQVYNTVTDVKTAIDTANLVLTVGGIAGAIFTGGTSVLATQGAKAAIIIAAKQIVKKVLFDYSLRKFMLTLIKEMGKAIAARAAVEVLAFVFNCVTHAIDTDNWSAENAKELGAEMIREFFTAENLSSTIDRDKVLQEWAKANVL